MPSSASRCHPFHILLIGHPTYTPDDSLWKTCRELREAGNAVEILDPVRHAELLLGDGSPNPAMLGKFNERFAPDYVAYQGEQTSDILGALASQEHANAKGRDGDAAARAESQERPRHFLVCGYVGCLNFGDELLFSLICDRLSERYPGSFVTLIGYEPDVSLRMHGVASLLAFDKADIDAELGDASALIFMGGMMFDAPFEQNTCGRIDMFLNPNSEIAGQAALTELAYINDVPTVYLGFGAGPLENPDARRIVKLASLTRPHYLVRDDATRCLLLESGVDASLISRKTDLAYSLPSAKAFPQTAGLLSDKGVAPGEYVVVSLRDHASADAGFVANVTAALDTFFERHAMRIVFLDLAPEDASMHHRVISAMKHGAEACLSVPFSSIADIIGIISEARVCLAMRLHCSIVASTQGVPSVGLAYNVKVKETYSQLGRDRFLLPMECTSDELVGALTSALEETPEEKSHWMALVERNRALANEAFDDLYAIVEAHPVQARKRPQYQRTKAYSELAEEDLRRRLSVSQEELSSARDQLASVSQELADVRSSTTWKVGRAITWLPRKLKDMLTQ
jgi:polysaccharide pyruvyl transferase WcaK-like protein